MKKMTMNKASENMTLDEAYHRFIKIKQLMNVSSATIKHYNGTYNQFIKCVSKETLIQEINIDTIYNFISFLKSRNEDIRAKSINSYLIDLRAFFNQVASEDKMIKINIRLVEDEERIAKTYTDEELEKLLKKPDLKNTSFSEYRNWVIVNYFLATGNRASTLCNLKINDLDFENNEIALMKLKGKRQYIIPMSEALKKILKEYLEYRNPKNGDDFVFCNQYGQQLLYDALSTAIERYNNARGVSKTSLHLFRHTFAKKWILNGGDIFRLQKILGHKSLEMVRNYVNMFNQDLKNGFEEFNPLDNFKTSDRKVLKLKK